MLVSLIINNYNYGRYLSACIQSALDQTYSTKEVIVVDDGSTDESRQIISEFGGRVKSILKPNGGQGSAMNIGFQVSSGDLIIFLDSDDLLYPTAIQQVVASWTDDCAKLQFPLDVINESGKMTGEIMPDKELAHGSVLSILLEQGTYVTSPNSGNVFCRRFLNKVMPIPEQTWVSHADAYLIHTAPFFGKIGRINAPLGQYRTHVNTLSLSALVLNGRVSPKRVRFHILRSKLEEELVKTHADRLGLELAADNLLTGHGHYKLRMVSLKLDPSNHPFVGDTLLSASMGYLRRVWSSAKLGFTRRLIQTAWLAAVLVLPKAAVEPLIVQGISPRSRGRKLSQIIETKWLTTH